MTNIQVVLPARLASTRLPEKLLRVVGGKTILQHTYEAASQARCARSGVVIAVDDERLARAVDDFGGQWIMTPKNCPSGTDRIAFVAEQLTQVEIFVNVQSDEPEIDPLAIDLVADCLANSDSAAMATVGTPIRSADDLHNPAIVKIVLGPSTVAASRLENDASKTAEQGRAIYFSRAPVPFQRDGDWEGRLAMEPPLYWHHLGLYAYRREFLRWFSNTPPSRLEEAERLEQLRAIEAGKLIVVAPVDRAAAGIDTPEDLEAFRQRFESGR
jgi:3-deoxy-manno-octulosonate cytidylyltransferase (CMP-KDO synthetase)